MTLDNRALKNVLSMRLGLTELPLFNNPQVRTPRLALPPKPWPTASRGFWLLPRGSRVRTAAFFLPSSAKPAADYSPIWLFELMRRYAKSRLEIATIFGSILRKYTPIQRRKTISCLLVVEVWLRTGKHHDKEVALLLTNAFEAAGHKRLFTEAQIKKHRQRYVAPPGVAAYRRSHHAVSTPD